MKKIVQTVAALFLLGAPALAADLATEVVNPSVQLGEGTKIFCSGEIIHSLRDQKTGNVNTVVLTAKHCVKGKVKVDILKNYYGKDLKKNRVFVYPGKVTNVSSVSDLAAITLDDKETLFEDTADIAGSTKPLEFGQEVTLLGYPLGLSMTLTKGNIGYLESVPSLSKYSSSNLFLRATPSVNHGSSGSSLFAVVDGKYQIIGVTSAMIRGTSFMNYFTPPQELTAFYNKIKKGW